MPRTAASRVVDQMLTRAQQREVERARMGKYAHGHARRILELFDAAGRRIISDAAEEELERLQALAREYHGFIPADVVIQKGGPISGQRAPGLMFRGLCAWRTRGGREYLVMKEPGEV